MKRIYTFGHEQVERNITVGDILENKKNNNKMNFKTNMIGKHNVLNAAAAIAVVVVVVVVVVEVVAVVFLFFYSSLIVFFSNFARLQCLVIVRVHVHVRECVCV